MQIYDFLFFQGEVVVIARDLARRKWPIELCVADSMGEVCPHLRTSPKRAHEKPASGSKKAKK